MNRTVFAVMISVFAGTTACETNQNIKETTGAVTCTPSRVDVDPNMGALYDMLLSNGQVAGIGEATTSTDAEGALVTEQAIEIDMGAQVAAGSLTCTLTGCAGNGIYCSRGGCKPNADKTDCTRCTCSGSSLCSQCECARAISVNVAAAPACEEAIPGG